MADNVKKVDFVNGRQKKLESNRTVWEAEWQEIADYVIPIREDIKSQKLQGSRQGTKIFDGAAVNAAVLATDGIHGYHVSPAFTWFRYDMARKVLNDIPEIREWLQDGVGYAMYTALERSNFYDEMWTYIYDGLTIGTAPMYMEEDIGEGKIVFHDVHPGEIYLAENRYGEVDTVHRKRKLTHRQAVQMFGEKNCPQQVREKWKDNPFAELEYIHAVFLREERNDRKKNAKNKRWSSVWIQGKHLCKESGYDKFPYAVWRYLKTGREVYGRSPASMALSEVIGLNLISKTLLGAAQMSVDPPLNIPSEMQGKVQWRPRGYNYYDESNRVVMPADTRINYPVGTDREERKQRIIEQHFHIDFFLMLARINEEKGERTAYEVAKLQEEKAAVLGSELAPLNKQLGNMLDFVYGVEYEAGRIPPPPDILLELMGERFEPVYLGPLAQAQRRLFGTQGIREGIDNVAPILQLNPTAADVIDFDKTARHTLENSGFPQVLLRKEEEIKALRQAREEAAQQEQIKEAMLQGSEAVKNIASADKDTDGGIKNMLTGEDE